MRSISACLILILALSPAKAGEPQQPDVRESIYAGDLVAFPGPWGLGMGRSGIVLVSDRELEMLADPDKVLNLSVTLDKREASLRQICEQAQQRGNRTLMVFFDHFFRQYRPGQDTPRRHMPDTDAYIQRIAAVGRFAEKYGLGLELSILSPLEIGPGYRAATGESGLWMHFRKGLRDPKTGAFGVDIWRDRRWANNKGVIDIEDAGVRVFAFSEKPVPGTPYRAVDPNAIRDITDAAKVDIFEGIERRHGDHLSVRARIHGSGHTDIGPLDRVLVVQLYRTPEMDYFSPKAPAFLQDLIDRYARAGVRLNGLYSDEMHIQQSWAYHSHHDHGQFAMRYASPGFAARFAELYGPRYGDFAKWLVYFCGGQEDTADDLTARAQVMHVFGPTPKAIRETALFRARYYHLLQDGVVDLFAGAKRHAEGRMGHRLEARAHATWAESPTIDFWETSRGGAVAAKYEYTPNFLWSATVHQAASACYDYFKWGDFLTGNGNDHAEGGWLDRNYWGLALACSTGILNDTPLSYAACWGGPAEIMERHHLAERAFGTAGSGDKAAPVTGLQHRDVSVLMLYPIDLVATDDRFGSWMTQYAYANWITQAKLLERGRVVGGAIEVAGRRFTTLAATFEPFPLRKLLALMRALAEGGGRAIWSGPPPVLTAEGGDALAEWSHLFGADYAPGPDEGVMAPGCQITFEGKLAGVPPQTILTHFLVDRIYPVTPRDGTQAAARANGTVVGAHRPCPNGGSATFLGYRPRDNQSRSLGQDERNWFDVLNALGAYPPSGRFPDINDNTEALSRTADLLVCRFPNGAIAIVPHYRGIVENWPGGFGRDREKDKAWLEKNPLPSDTLRLRGFKANGHTIDYEGVKSVVFRLDAQGQVIAFAGHHANQITVDGKTTRFSEGGRGTVCWAPIAEERRVNGGAVLQVKADGNGAVRIPAPGLTGAVKLFAEGPTPGSRGAAIACHIENGVLVFEPPREAWGRWIYVVPCERN
ncbi:MAG TPA: hypothetical protein PLU30_14920 [Verrucomicrobiae bacterium]|nr:hypothetical protein [Verrucomicrobiae bacterium]